MRILLALVLLCSAASTPAQTLRPGFDREEYLALLRVSAQFGGKEYAAQMAPLPGYRMLYRSPIVGLDNRWDYWMSPEGTRIISIRGTTSREASWLANFYAAMVPAKGRIRLSDSLTFSYDLATNPRATVHAGWLVSTGFLSNDILPRLEADCRRGVRNVLIVGHSQGGAIAFLLTAHLYSLQRQGQLPADLRFKTYCSAGPKPGNVYFAYDYEAMSQEGWAYNVINALDWVPQTPFSVQTVDDFVPINPFSNARQFIRQQKWPRRLALNYGYGKLTHPSRKAAKRYRKFLGGYVEKAVRKNLPGFIAPEYAATADYVRAGNQILLQPDSAYYRRFPQGENQFFANHFHAAYAYLAGRLAGVGDPPRLDGAWELVRRGDSLLPEQVLWRPTLVITGNAFNLYTGCNSATGELVISGADITFPASMAMTKKFCSGVDEAGFLSDLRSVNRWELREGRLVLLTAGKIVMAWERTK